MVYHEEDRWAWLSSAVSLRCCCPITSATPLLVAMFVGHSRGLPVRTEEGEATQVIMPLMAWATRATMAVQREAKGGLERILKPVSDSDRRLQFARVKSNR